MEKDGRLVNRAQAPQVPDRNPSMQSNQIAQVVDATPEQLDSIKKYKVNINYYSTKCYYMNSKLFENVCCSGVQIEEKEGGGGEREEASADNDGGWSEIGLP